MRNCLKIVSIILIIGIILIIAGISGGGNMKRYNNNNLTEIKHEFDESINSLELKIDLGEVEIKTGDKFRVEVSDINKEKIDVKIENNKLIIISKKFTFLNFGDYNPKMTVYIPSNYEFENISVKLGTGQLIANNLTSKETDLKVGTGRLETTNHTSNNTNINCGAGQIVYQGKITNNAEIDCGVGEIKLDLNGNEKDYNYDLDVGIGEVSINESRYAGLGNNKNINNNQVNKLFNIKCGIGRIEIKIK